MTNKIDYNSMDIDSLSVMATQTYTEKDILDKKLKSILPALFGKMKESEISEVKSPFGRYYQSHSTKYTYSEATQKLADQLAQAQEREKAEGIAHKIESLIYKYGKLTKEDNDF